MTKREWGGKLSWELQAAKIMIKLILSLLAVLILSNLALAQESGRRGGPYIMLNYLNLDSVNDYLKDLGLSSFGEKRAILWGCEGMSIRDSVAFGGLFSHGSVVKQLGTQRQELSINFGGPILEYRILEKDSFDFALVGGVGGAKIDLTLIGEKSSKFSLTSFLLHAGLKFAYRVSEKLSLKVAVGYNCASREGWRRKAGDLALPSSFDLSSLHFRVGFRFSGSK